MGCGASDSGQNVQTISVHPPHEELKIRMRLRGDLISVNAAMVKGALIKMLECASPRIEVESSEKADVYFAIVKSDTGDEPGTVRRLMKRIIDATGTGIQIEDKAKIIGGKEYLQISDLED